MKRSRKSRGEDQETDNDTRNCTGYPTSPWR